MTALILWALATLGTFAAAVWIAYKIGVNRGFSEGYQFAWKERERG